MHLLLADSAQGSPFVTLTLILIGSGGLGGAVLAFLKLKPEANSAAVSQAQGANETLVSLNDRLKQDLDAERARRLEAEKKVADLETMLHQMKDMIHGMVMADAPAEGAGGA